MNKNKWILISFLLGLCLFFLTFVLDSEKAILLENIEINTNDSEFEKVLESAKPEPERPAGTKPVESEAVEKYHNIAEYLKRCDSVIDFYQQRNREWGKHLPEIPAELSLAYDSEEIALALLKSNASSRKVFKWLSYQKTSKSESNLRNIRFKEQHQLERVTLEGDHNISIDMSTGIPASTLIKLFEFDRTERDQYLSQITLLAKDLESLVVGNQLNQAQVIELMDYVANVDEVFGLNYQTRLVEIAVRYEKDRLFEYLLGRGVQLESSPLYNNLLEIVALRQVYSHSNLSYEEYIVKRLPVITTLQSLGLPLRWAKPNLDLYYIGAKCEPKGFSSSYREKFDVLSKFGLLNDEPFDYEKDCRVNSSLIDVVEELRENFVFAGKDSDFANHTKKCIDYRQQAEELISRNNSQVNTDSASKKTLNSLEPQLVNCRLDFDAFDDRKSLEYLNSTEKHQLISLYDTKPYESLLGLQQLDWDHVGKASIFWSFFRKKEIDMQPIINRGFKPRMDDYSDLGKLSVIEFKRLQSYELNFRQPTMDGRTPVYSATEQCNIPLVSYLYAENYGYHNAKYGIDPLALVISMKHYQCRRSDGNSRIELVRRLMRFNPAIKNYHFTSMAKLKLTERKFYERLVGEFEELKPSNSVVPTGYSCSVFY